MAFKKLKVGVIGLGMGRAHIASYREHPSADIVAIADTDPARLRDIGDQYGIASRHLDAREMLKTQALDVVSIVTPNALHLPLTVAAFAAGCHVLCEKPMAMNAAEGRKMLAAARRAKRRLMINFSYRFNPASWGLKAKVDKGVLGDVYFARTIWHRHRGLPGFGGWFGTKAMSGGGPLIDLGVHRIDLALWLMGYPEPAWALANTYNAIAAPMALAQEKTFDVEDMAAGFVRFKNGATLAIEASWAANVAEPELMETRLLGTKAGLVQRNVGGGYHFEAELITSTGSPPNAKSKTMPIGDAKAPSFARHFIDCILKDKPHLATGEEGLTVMRILDALYASARTGKPVKC